jgi:hypothetical protein
MIDETEDTMPVLKEMGVRVHSNAFTLWKAKEAREKRRIPIDTLIKETGLAKMTVRRFLSTERDVSSAALSSAVILADYFGVPLADLISIERETTQA